MCNFHRSWESIRHCLSHPISTVNYLVVLLEVLRTDHCMQYVSINDFNASQKSMKYALKFTFWAITFWIFINDLHFVIKNSVTFHHADDNCLLNTKQLNKETNKSKNKEIKSLLH